MSRYYSSNISKEDFLEKIKKIAINIEENYELPKKVGDDLNKVVFDWENHTLHFDEEKNKFDNKNFANYEVGYKELKPGFHTFFVNAGGDWEYPICFILYWDGSSIRAYIPEEGNVYNKTYKTAYGSEGDTKIKNLPDVDWNGEDKDQEYDYDKMIQDIESRIILKSDDSPKEKKPRDKCLTMEEKIGGMLFSIHHHHPETEKIIYYEEDIVKLLKALGHPEPKFGNVLSIKDFKKTYKPKKIPWWLNIKKGQIVTFKNNKDKFKFTGTIELVFKNISRNLEGHFYENFNTEDIEEINHE